MNYPTIIGLAGLARSGKDTVARHLEKQHDFQSLAFADPLRAMLAKGFDLEYSHFNDHKDDIIPWLGLSARRLMQTLGTEWVRSLRTDIWVLLMQKRIEEHFDAKDLIVITDIRFDDEANWVRQHGFLWHIKRPDHLRISLTESAAAHVSEDGIQPHPGDRLLYNDSTLISLYKQVDTQVHLLPTIGH